MIVNTLTIHPDLAPPKVVQPVALGVYIEGERRRDLHVDGWTVLPAPDFGRAKITLTMASPFGPHRRLENTAACRFAWSDRIHGRSLTDT